MIKNSQKPINFVADTSSDQEYEQNCPNSPKHSLKTLKQVDNNKRANFCNDSVVSDTTALPFKIIKFSKTFVCPFKTPFKSTTLPSQRVLGVLRRRTTTLSFDRPAFNPDDETQIVLYAPKQLSALEKLKCESIGQVSEMYVVVDPVLTRVLRPHQIEGVKFMYNCTTGEVLKDAFGCIMADEMGLGKTVIFIHIQLQCITLLWTLMKQSPNPKKSYINSCVIACPSSLVKNWANEIYKWVGNSKIQVVTCGENTSTANGSTSKQRLTKEILNFFSLSKKSNCAPVLISSYETLRANADIIGKREIGLMLCDEGHRLKNSSSQTFVTLNALNVKRRVILSGTPIQNDLTEYFSLFNFANPGLLGSPSDFRKNYEIPILRGRDACATQKEQEIGDKKLEELNGIANKFIIRRTNNILSKYLPTKFEYVVFCRMSELQLKFYENFLKSGMMKKIINDDESKSSGGTQPLKAITLLKKLCNHPQLIDPQLRELKGYKDIIRQMAVHIGGNINSYKPQNFSTIWSTKFIVLEDILINIKLKTKDKIVVISNYTQTLDLIELLCNTKRFSFLRLDGTMTINKRQKLVDKFNDPNSDSFIFLLSSKAGGCGINLIGANRLILFDPDWNPASDMQALARVWRDGQKKTCFIYRLITTGTIEEKIFQRQSHKQTLSRCVVDSNTTNLDDMERHFSAENLKMLFKLNTETNCETHDTFKCKRCVNGRQYKSPPEPMLYSDTSIWDHFSNLELIKINDSILKNTSLKDFEGYKEKLISFVFQFKSHDQIKV